MFSVMKHMVSENSKIVFHTDCEPSLEKFDESDGKVNYWREIRRIAGSRIVVVKVKVATTAWKRNLKEPIKMSDFYRLLLLIKFGGIYTDADLIFIKSHQEFYKNPIANTPSIAIESSCSLANGFMITKSNSKILLRWLLEYKFFDNFHMGTFSVMKIWALWRAYREEINAVQAKFVRPNWREIRMLAEFFNWKLSFNVHLSLRYLPPHLGMKTEEEKKNFMTEIHQIDCMENSLGEMLRETIYWSDEIC